MYCCFQLWKVLGQEECFECSWRVGFEDAHEWMKYRLRIVIRICIDCHGTLQLQESCMPNSVYTWEIRCFGVVDLYHRSSYFELYSCLNSIFMENSQVWECVHIYKQKGDNFLCMRIDDPLFICYFYSLNWSLDKMPDFWWKGIGCTGWKVGICMTN